MKKLHYPVLIVAASLLLAGCSATPSTPAASNGELTIVASTNVYGSIAESLVGDKATVTSIINSSAQDPHSFEAGAQDRLAVSRADLVIVNGGGYDPFMDALVSASPKKPEVFTVLDASGVLGDHDHADTESTEEAHDHAATEPAEDHSGHGHIEGVNEHVWYSLSGIEHAATHLNEVLGKLDPQNADTYTANLKTFTGKIDGVLERASAIEAKHGHRHVVLTELVPLYLLEEAGFENVTPEAFTEAIEEGTDVAPALMKETLDRVAGGDVALLAYNEQTGGPETERVRTAANDAKIPVVTFTETLPDGMDYVSWMSDNLDRLEKATA